MQIQKIGLIVFSIVLLSCMVSAGFFDKITGRASSQPTNLSVTVVGVSMAQIISVSTISNVDLNESSYISVNFTLQMYDPDGAGDLNNTSVFANFSRVNETTRTTTSYCSFQNNIGSYTRNYSCSIDMWYWDGNGLWNVSIRGKDIGNGTEVYNLTTTFQVNLLKAMVISPYALTWLPVSSGALNQTSNNDPTYINNTGNYNSTIQVTALNLLGETTPADFIPAANFSLGLTTSGSNPECMGTLMVNGTATTVTNSNANRGNLSLGGGLGQEEFYYCITQVPYVSSQPYSTLNGGSWTITYP